MFGSKRKARKIQVSEDNEEPTLPSPSADEPMTDGEFTYDQVPNPAPFR